MYDYKRWEELEEEEYINSCTEKEEFESYLYGRKKDRYGMAPDEIL